MGGWGHQLLGRGSIALQTDVVSTWKSWAKGEMRNCHSVELFRGRDAVKGSFTVCVFLLKMATCHGARGAAGCSSHFGQSCFEPANSLCWTD